MRQFFFVLGIGFVIGFFGLVKGKGLAINNKMQTVWLVLLIFCMGVSIGNSEDVMANLPQLGLKSLLFAVGPILGSVLMVYVVSRIFLKEKDSE